MKSMHTFKSCTLIIYVIYLPYCTESEKSMDVVSTAADVGAADADVHVVTCESDPLPAGGEPFRTAGGPCHGGVPPNRWMVPTREKPMEKPMEPWMMVPG